MNNYKYEYSNKYTVKALKNMQKELERIITHLEKDENNNYSPNCINENDNHTIRCDNYNNNNLIGEINNITNLEDFDNIIQDKNNIENSLSCKRHKKRKNYL